MFTSAANFFTQFQALVMLPCRPMPSGFDSTVPKDNIQPRGNGCIRWLLIVHHHHFTIIWDPSSLSCHLMPSGVDSCICLLIAQHCQGNARQSSLFHHHWRICMSSYPWICWAPCSLYQWSRRLGNAIQDAHSIPQGGFGENFMKMPNRVLTNSKRSCSWMQSNWDMAGVVQRVVERIQKGIQSIGHYRVKEWGESCLNMTVLSAWTRYERKATTKMNVEIVHFAELIKFTSETKRNDDVPLGGLSKEEVRWMEMEKEVKCKEGTCVDESCGEGIWGGMRENPRGGDCKWMQYWLPAKCIKDYFDQESRMVRLHSPSIFSNNF